MTGSGRDLLIKYGVFLKDKIDIYGLEELKFLAEAFSDVNVGSENEEIREI
eukprot:CAMPEP_0170554802 /NCGR_PEP_ID=MMETSP0211-20121228/12681_1 /TAXON_ID=311385 /ORGANISM="Pseudokeronopsis sp., Strain OXSARD2" /LENGTH=50 /DNA_ID=CAMNT_0010864157 /DNA_START=100 /DNA_END=252 /DNA_ORIENTATION=+